MSKFGRVSINRMLVHVLEANLKYGKKVPEELTLFRKIFTPVGGVPEIRFSLESSYFCYLGAHVKFHNPSCLLSGRKVTTSEEEERKRNNGKYYGHYVGACTAPLGPKAIV